MQGGRGIQSSCYDLSANFNEDFSITVKGVTIVEWEGGEREGCYIWRCDAFCKFQTKILFLSKYKTERQVQNEIDQVEVQTVPTNQ